MPRPALSAHRPDGSILRLALDRWLGPLTAADEAVLDRAQAPVLDVGCGPGRHVLALARRGHLALGVDIAPAAVRVARLRGAPAIEASVFARIPGAGTWGSALLLDGNIGIGGAPEALLARMRQLLAPGGDVLVELAAPGVALTSEHIHLEYGGQLSRPFPWAYVGVDAIDASGAGRRFHRRRALGRRTALVRAARGNRRDGHRRPTNRSDGSPPRAAIQTSRGSGRVRRQAAGGPPAAGSVSRGRVLQPRCTTSGSRPASAWRSASRF